MHKSSWVTYLLSPKYLPYLFQMFHLVQPFDAPNVVVRYPQHSKLGVGNQAEHALDSVVTQI